MAASTEMHRVSDTADQLVGLVHRIVHAVNPIAVIAFGSRARGDHQGDSDLDLAVIVDGSDENHARIPDEVRGSFPLSLDLLTVPIERFERFRPWVNTVHRQIDREGIRLYERGRQSSDRCALERLCAGRENTPAPSR